MAENETPYAAGFRAGRADTLRKYEPLRAAAYAASLYRNCSAECEDRRIAEGLLQEELDAVRAEPTADPLAEAAAKLSEAVDALQTRIIAHPSVPRCYRGNAASDAWDDSAAEIRTSDEWDRLAVALAALRALLLPKGERP